MKTEHISLIGLAALVVGFIGGMLYGKNSASAVTPEAIQAMSADQRQQLMQALFANGGGSGRGGRGGMGGGGMRGNGASGEIISKDAKSITVKLRAGGSKLILIDAKTQYKKLGDAKLDDMAIGKQIQVTGDANSDGSVTAQIVQLRPDDMGGAATSTAK